MAHVLREYAQLLESGRRAWLVEQELLIESNSASVCIGTKRVCTVSGPGLQGTLRGLMKRPREMHALCPDANTSATRQAHDGTTSSGCGTPSASVTALALLAGQAVRHALRYGLGAKAD